VTIKTLVSRGTTNTAVARLMGVTEGPIHYHVSRIVTGAVDPVAALSGSLAARVSPTARFRKPTQSTNWRGRHGLDYTVERRHRRCFARGGARARVERASGATIYACWWESGDPETATEADLNPDAITAALS
jgi:hypothetical protein